MLGERDLSTFQTHRDNADLPISVLLVFFVVSVQEQIQNNLSVYVTSTFLALPLTGTTSIVSGIVGGVIKLPAAKFIDLIGRTEGFAIFTFFATMGRSPPSLHWWE
jgi:hypothetical protein